MPSFLQLNTTTTDVSPEVLGFVAGFPVTNTLVMSVFIVLVLALFGLVVRRFSLVPGPVQNATEELYEKMRDFVEQITGDTQMAQNIFPLIGALFIYIGVADLLPLVPGLTSITYAGDPLFRMPTTDINLTLGLAVAMVMLVQIRSMQDWGVFNYIGRFLRFKQLIRGFQNGIKSGLISLVHFFVGLLNIISEAAKAISLSFRLFGNMFAGEIIAVLLLGAVAYVVPALWLSMNILFGIVHALVFGALTAAYYTLAMKQEATKQE